MNAVDLGVNLFVTLFALLDPIGNLPIFAAATAGATLRQRISVSALICAFATLFLAFFLFTLVAVRVICQGGITYFTLTTAPLDAVTAFFGSPAQVTSRSASPRKKNR